MRFCHDCIELKPAAEFHKNSGMAGGRLHTCKDCLRVKVRVYRQANRETIRARQLAWEQLPASKAKARVRLAAWRAANPLRRAAHVALNNALRDGRVAAQPCWVCGAAADAHHPDYSTPLDVVWLCKSHHRQAHEAAK